MKTIEQLKTEEKRARLAFRAVNTFEAMFSTNAKTQAQRARARDAWDAAREALAAAQGIEMLHPID